MSKFCILLSMVVLVSGFCIFLSHANIVRQSKGQAKVTPKSRRLQTTTQSDYFFDGSGYGESGLNPNFDDDDAEGGDDDDDDDYLGSGLDFKTPHVEPFSAVTPLVSSPKQQTTFSTSTQVTVDVEPTESSVTSESAVQREVVKEHQAVPSEDTTEPPADGTDVTSDPRMSTPLFALNLTTSEASSPSTASSTTSTTASSTALPTSITTATKVATTVATTTTRATTSTAPPVPTSRTSHRPTRRTTTTTTTTTTRKPATRTTTSFKDDDLDGGDDDDAITDLDNNLHPTPGKDNTDNGVSIDKQEEDTNEVLSNLPVMYRVSNLPKLAFLSQSGVLAGIIAGSIVVLLCLVLLIMFVVYHLKRKSEPAFDRSTRSPVKAGYKKALDKDIYG